MNDNMNGREVSEGVFDLIEILDERLELCTATGTPQQVGEICGQPTNPVTGNPQIGVSVGI